MAFPFPQIIEKEIFKYTFLNKVAFKILYPEDKDFKDVVDIQKAAELFKSVFNLTFSKEHYHNILESRQKLVNSDGSVSFEFCRSSVKITMGQSQYSSFSDSLEPILRDFLKEFAKWYDSCRNIQLKYIDIWPVAQADGFKEDTFKSLEDAIFSEKLRKSIQNTIENSKYAEFNQDNIRLLIKYGYFISDDKEFNSGVGLETRCRLADETRGIKTESILPEVKKMNSALYDAFRWSITDSVVNAMRNKA